MTIAEKQDLKCSGELQFCSFFYAFESTEGKVRKTTRRWEKARPGLDYRLVNMITRSLEGGCSLFQRPVNLDAQKQWTDRVCLRQRLTFY